MARLFPHAAFLVWAEGLHDLFEASLFDGIWISENEINQLMRWRVSKTS